MSKKIFIILTLLLPSIELFAGNANSFFLGNDAALTAGSHAAIVSDSEAIWYNPAGLGGNELTRISLTTNAFMMRLQDVDNGMSVILPSGTKSENLNSNEFLFVPTAITLATRATDNISWGLGVFVPQYQDETFQNDISSVENFPGIIEPVAYRQGFDLDILDMEYDIGGAVGWEVHPKFKIGFALFGLYERTRLNRNEFEDIQSADGSGTTSLFFVDNYRALVSTIGIRSTLGMQYLVTPNWQLALVAFTPSFQIVSWGNVSADSAGAVAIGPGPVALQAERYSRKIFEWEGDMVEPFHAQAAIAYKQPDYWIGLAADLAIPLKNVSLFIDKPWRWNIEAGSKFKLTDKINMGAGIFTDRTDTNKITALGDTKINYYGLVFGAEFKTPIKRDSGPPVVFSTTIGGRYALGIGQVGGELFDPEKDGSIADAKVVARDTIYNELSLHLGTSFLF